MADRIGYLKESGYAAEGNVIRHGDVLRDVLVDQSTSMRVLGMIGLCDVEAVQNEILAGTAPLAYMILEQDGTILKSKVRYTNSNVDVYGFDPELLDVRQMIRIEMHGYTAFSIITLTEG